MGQRAAGVNAIRPDIIITPLARDEFNGRPSEGYRHLPELSTAGRCGTSDEVATLSLPFLDPDGAFITQRLPDRRWRRRVQVLRSARAGPMRCPSRGPERAPHGPRRDVRSAEHCDLGSGEENRQPPARRPGTGRAQRPSARKRVA